MTFSLPSSTTLPLIPWWQFKEDDVNMWLIPYSHYVVSIFDLNNSILLGNNILKITIFLKTPFPKLLLPKAVFLDSSAQQGRGNHPTFSLIVIIRYRNSSCTWDYTSSSLLSLTFSNPCPITRSIPSHSSSSTKTSLATEIFSVTEWTSIPRTRRGLAHDIFKQRCNLPTFCVITVTV